MWSFFLILVYAEHTAKSLQPCPTLCDPIDGSPPGSPVAGLLQARVLEGGAISFSNAWTWNVKVKSLSRVGLSSDPIGCSPPGSPVAGILQARVLEVGAIAISVRGAYPAATSSSWNGHESQSRGDGGSHASSCTNFPRMHWMSPRLGQGSLSGSFHTVLPAFPLLSSWVEYPFFGVPLSWYISSFGEKHLK